MRREWSEAMTDASRGKAVSDDCRIQAANDEGESEAANDEALSLLLHSMNDSLVDCAEVVVDSLDEHKSFAIKEVFSRVVLFTCLTERFGLVTTRGNSSSSEQGPFFYRCFA